MGSENACFIPSDTKENITMIGSSRGLWNKDDCIASGVAGATDALNRLGVSKTNYFFPKPGGWEKPNLDHFMKSNIKNHVQKVL